MRYNPGRYLGNCPSSEAEQTERLRRGEMKKLPRGLLTLILLMWRIWRAPNNASEWQMGFNSAFRG